MCMWVLARMCVRFGHKKVKKTTTIREKRAEYNLWVEIIGDLLSDQIL